MSGRPHCRTALVGEELGRYGIQMALTETRFAEVRAIQKVGARYTFFWNGHAIEALIIWLCHYNRTC